MVAWAGLVAVLIAPVYSIFGIIGLGAGVSLGLLHGSLAGFSASILGALTVGFLPAALCLFVALFFYWRRVSIETPKPWIVIGVVAGPVAIVAVYFSEIDDLSMIGMISFSAAFGGGIAGVVFWSVLTGKLIWFARLHVMVLSSAVLYAGWGQILRLDQVRCANQRVWTNGIVSMAGTDFRFDSPVCAVQESDALTVYFPVSIMNGVSASSDSGDDDRFRRGASVLFIQPETFSRIESAFLQPSEKFGPPVSLGPGLNLQPPAKTNAFLNPRPLREAKAVLRTGDVLVLAEINRTEGLGGEITHNASLRGSIDGTFFFALSHLVRDSDLERSALEIMTYTKRVVALIREGQSRAE